MARFAPPILLLLIVVDFLQSVCVTGSPMFDIRHSRTSIDRTSTPHFSRSSIPATKENKIQFVIKTLVKTPEDILAVFGIFIGIVAVLVLVITIIRICWTKLCCLTPPPEKMASTQ